MDEFVVLFVTYLLEQQCLDILNDHFLTQHVSQPTRYRNTQSANILDTLCSLTKIP